MMYLLKSVATPIIWIIVLLIIGLTLLARCRKKWVVRLGWWCSILGTLILLVLSIPLFSNLLIYSLECRYTMPAPEVLSTLDVVVVINTGPRCGSLNLVNGIWIFKQSSAQILILPGGDLQPDGARAELTPKIVAQEMGVPQIQIVTQSLSRTTIEDAIESGRLIPAGSKRCIGIVTCASHMLRTKWAFEKELPDDTIVPIPIGGRYTSPSFQSRTVVPSIEAFHNSARAAHEWIGLLWYSVRHIQIGGE